ncbi:hypothetical protein SDJN03_04906, partial [Cucurbita argyrosperma subsp. sororia]
MKVNHIAAVLLLLLLPLFDSGYCVEDPFIKMKLGGVRDYIGAQNSLEIDALARFAVQEHNKKENGLLEFERVLKAKEQVVAGIQTMAMMDLQVPFCSSCSNWYGK